MSTKKVSYSFLRGRLGIAVLALGFVGCESVSNPFERETPREQASTSVDKAAGEVAEINGRLDGALRALDDLVNHPTTNLRRQYNAFSTALNQLENSTETLSKVSSEMQTQGQNYFINWDREIAAIHNEDLRNRSEQRRADVAARFDAIRDRYVAAREELAPVVRRLNEIETALEVDLTPSGVETVRPALNDLNNATDPARNALRELGEDLRRASAALAPEAVRNLNNDR